MRKFILFLLLILAVQDLKSQSMEWLCRPGKFSDIQYMGYDLFKVKDDTDKCGVFSADGKQVLGVRYDNITSFVEERALILDKSGQRIIGIIDKNGEIVKSFENEQIFATAYPYFKEGLLGYKDHNGLCGYINSQGNISIVAQFHLAAPFQDGIATVQYPNGHYYGLINKTGAPAIISDIKYLFLSSLVDGYLFAVTPSRKGGEQLRIMRLEGNGLKSTKTIINGYFIDLSDDYSSLSVQNGNHYYYIDEQWRISGANYNFNLPYTIDDKLTFITQTSELLSKQESKNGIQITYMGEPILEHSFDNVETYEKKYAIVRAKDKTIGVLKLNPSAGIELIEPTQVFVFNHNPRTTDLSANLDEVELNQDVEVQVDIKDVNPTQLKCYINEDGYLRYAPLKQHNGIWKLHLPYFHPDTKYDNIISKKIDIAITYDGLDWMHREINLSTKHEPGYVVQITGNDVTDDKGIGKVNIIIESIKGVPNKMTRIDITGQKTIYFKGQKEVISIPVNNIPEGGSKTFIYTVTITEEGCPIVKETVRKIITYPKQKKEEKREEKKEIIII